MKLTRVLVKNKRVHFSTGGRIHRNRLTGGAIHAKSYENSNVGNVQRLKDELERLHVATSQVPKPKPKKYISVKM